MENKQNNAPLRRNIKLPDTVFHKLKALNNVKRSYKQYEIVDMILDSAINQLTDQEKDFYEYQLSEIQKKEG